MLTKEEGTVRLLVAGDLHKRAKDITTIEGYVQCTKAVQAKLMEEIEDKNVDIFISLGDWYDKGYATDVAASLADYDLDIKMAHQLKGKFYGLIGNHIRLGLDSNPELHIIQPHDVYKTRCATPRDEQIMKTPNRLILNNVQVSLVHFNPNERDARSYKVERVDGVKYHIALYHTHLVIPGSQLVGTGYEHITSRSEAITDTLSNVDLAVVGHVHKPLGAFTVDLEDRQMKMIVPGSLTNTDTDLRSRHTEIRLPLIDISKEGNVTFRSLSFSLLTNMVTFREKNTATGGLSKLKSLKGKALKELKDKTSGDLNLVFDGSLLSFNAFMQKQGYTEMDKQLIKSVITAPNDIDQLLNIYKDNVVY